jgi:hypothetical protein
MRHITVAAAALLFALTGYASADTSEVETVGKFLLSMPARSMDSVIDHCSENVPEIKDDLLKERAGLIYKFTEAGKPLMEALKSDPEFNAPVQESMRQEMARADSYAFGIFKQQDPNVVCRRALTNIQNATVEELRKVVEDTYRKYRDAGKVDSSE